MRHADGGGVISLNFPALADQLGVDQLHAQNAQLGRQVEVITLQVSNQQNTIE